MNARRYSIALVVALLITAAEFLGLSVLAGNAHQTVRRVVAWPQTGIPVLPTITVRPTHDEVAAALAGLELAGGAHPDHAMPFYSFAAKPAVADKG